MKREHTRLLQHLAEQAIWTVTRGDLAVAIERSKQPPYEELLKLRYIKVRHNMFGKTYCITRKGWDALSKRVKRSIIVTYKDWYKRTKPTIAGPQWLNWTKI